MSKENLVSFLERVDPIFSEYESIRNAAMIPVFLPTIIIWVGLIVVTACLQESLLLMGAIFFGGPLAMIGLLTIRRMFYILLWLVS